MTLEQDIKNIETQLINWRRTLHANPELSFEEHWTSDYIVQELSKFENIEISKPTATSVLGRLEGAKPGRKIGLRADIDALPIKEDRPDLEFSSVNDGRMHACGHDAHAAMLLAAAKVLNNHVNELSGEIYFIFQHAEELPPGGAQEIMATGVLNDLDFIYGQHVYSTFEKGMIGIKTGPVTSNSDTFEVTIRGYGGHASQPENSVDPLIISTKAINSIQDIISRMIAPLDSAIISTTNIHAGEGAQNVIPNTAWFSGSVRTVNESTRDFIEKKIEQAVKSQCEFYCASYDFHYARGYSSVINSEEETRVIEQLLNGKFGDRVFEMDIQLGGEDFSAYSEKIPATFVMLGARNSDKDMIYPHHHPKFAIDEDVLIDGVAMLVTTAFKMTREDY